MVDTSDIVSCLKLLQISYFPNTNPLIIWQTDEAREPYKLSVSILTYDTLVLVSHYLPLSVGDAIIDFDRIMLERNRLVIRAKYERDPKANEYRVRGHVDLDQVFNCSLLMAALLDIYTLMSYRQRDRDEAIDPRPRLSL